MSNKTYYQRNREVALNKAKDYYENNKEKLREQARNRYRNLPEEENIKKREYEKNRYHNMPEEKKAILKDEHNSKSSLIRFVTFLFLTSYLHSSKSI